MTFKLTLNQGTLNISKHHNEAIVTTDGLSNKDTGGGGGGGYDQQNSTSIQSSRSLTLAIPRYRSELRSVGLWN